MAQTEIPFALDWKFEGPSASYFAAIDNGHFGAEDLPLEITARQSSLDAIPKVATGAFPVGFADINSLLRFLDENPGAPVTVMIMVYDKPPFAVAGRKSQGIESVADLEGSTLGGKPVTGPRKTVGMAFQNPVLLEWRSILQNVMLPPEIVSTGMSKRQQQDRARELLARVGLEGFEDKKPSELSGGMRQRASLCRSLVHRREVLILDEPFGALDAFTREDLWQTMHDLRHVERFTCVLITHDQRESVFLSDRTVVFGARPERAQRTVEIDLGKDRTSEDLHAPCAVELLRHAPPGRRPSGSCGHLSSAPGIAVLGQWLAQLRHGLPVRLTAGLCPPLGPLSHRRLAGPYRARS